MNASRRKLLPAIISCLCIFILQSNANAGTNIYVTNDGTDTASCGAQQHACRSISQGIENATTGDTILVGAGRYGNISGSPTYTGPGDEHPQPMSLQGATGCIVCIDKAISLFSLHGASVTVIEGAPLTTLEANVMILHDGVTFGALGRGFTITGGSAYGVLLDQDSPGSQLGIPLKSNITIAGDVDLADSIGFAFIGRKLSDTQCPDPSCIPASVITFSNDESVDNPGSAFSMTQGLFSGGSIALQYNYAHGAGVGFDLPGGPQSPLGLPESSMRISLVGNVATHNGLGFYALAPGQMVANTAAVNLQAGFEVVSGQGAFQNNTAVGNAGPGAIVQFFTDGIHNPGLLGFQEFSQNNFYGNDRHRPALAIQIAQFPPVSLNPGPGAHCGVLNLGVIDSGFGGAPPSPPIVAALQAGGNFWGTTLGPSPTGAADAVGGACDQNGGVTTAATFVTAGFAITTH